MALTKILRDSQTSHWSFKSHTSMISTTILIVFQVSPNKEIILTVQWFVAPKDRNSFYNPPQNLLTQVYFIMIPVSMPRNYSLKSICVRIYLVYISLFADKGIKSCQYSRQVPRHFRALKQRPWRHNTYRYAFQVLFS